MRVNKQKMPEGKATTDKPSMYTVRTAISAPRRTVNVPVLTTHTLEFKTAPVTLGRAPWEMENE